MDIKIDETKNIAYIKLTGPLSSKEILNAFDATVSHEDYKKGMGRLWDFTNANLSSIDSETIRSMAQHSLKYTPGINDVKVAFVVTRTTEYGLSRMFQLSSQAKTPIDVFKSTVEAENWLME